MALPLAYVPIAGANNPVLVARVGGLTLDLDVEVIPFGGEDRIELPEPVAGYVARFKRELEKAVSMRFRLICGGRADYDALAYVRVTNEVVRSLFRLDADSLGLAYRLDYGLGLADHVPALRPADLVTSHYAWRYGEPLVELGQGTVLWVRRIRALGGLGQPFLEVSREALVHVVGRSAVALARAFAEGNPGRIARILEFVNGLWHSVYGLGVPCGETPSTYVPGLGGVYCVELELSPRTS